MPFSNQPRPGHSTSPHHTASALPTIPAAARVAPPQKVIKAIQTHRSDIPMIMSYERGDFFYVTGELPADEKCPEGWYQALNPLTGSRGRVPRTDFEEFHKGGRSQNLGPSSSSPVVPANNDNAGWQQSSNPSYSPQNSRAHSPLPPQQAASSQLHLPPPSSSQLHPPLAFTPATSAPLSRQTSQQPSLHRNQSTSASAAASMLDGNVSAISDTASGKGKPQPLYAVVQFDFVAERPDELDAKAGEPIIVIAQSNHEWFVAKPIGRLGGPGLIPVSFVEIRDPVTSRPIENVAQILAQGQVQRIEEWKSATARYKENSIPLGSLGDFRNVGMADGQDQGRTGNDMAEQPTTNPRLLMNGDIISTHVKSFHYEANAYWFRINALFLPDDPYAPATSLVLYRLYEDFYNFQITLLDLFPREAGRTTRASNVSGIGNRGSLSGYSGSGRILPYMPGPCDRVDVDITNERRKELDLYLYELLELRSHGGGYILRHEHVLNFFTPGSGDMTDTIDREEAKAIAQQVAEAGAATKRAIIAESQSRGSSMRQSVNAANSGEGRTSSGAGMDQRFSAMRLNDGDQRSRSQQAHSRSTSMDQSQQEHEPNALLTRIPGASATSLVQRNGIPETASTSNSLGRTAGLTSTPSSAGGHNTTSAPSQSATAPQPAYIKIKILDRHTDDMVAVRVPPKVTYAQLLEKVRSRFYAEISILQYRVGQGRIPGAPNEADAGRELGDVMDDRTLWEWLETHDKYVLYAE
ncbi:hypothetical protein QFC21_003319 [Naganishia friedmannii]|uniref:Uncharacterized protein n=1 Tax=Naganishia friedmannii TaxID=89922 RepID=A0ACC2VQT3_9TREE|nr:hypothetical protein QFC21_003319 [Naganishia friedmannii]